MKWIAEAVPRAYFGKDLLKTFGVFITIFRVLRNNAEARLAAMRAAGWKPESVTAFTKTAVVSPGDTAGETEETDLEEAARDRIAQMITARFKAMALRACKASRLTTASSGRSAARRRWNRSVMRLKETRCPENSMKKIRYGYMPLPWLSGRGLGYGVLPLAPGWNSLSLQ